MDRNIPLINIIDREFRRIERQGGTPCKTVHEMAVLLGINKTLFSKLRSGDRTLSPKTARRIAEMLRREMQPKEIEDLYEELMQYTSNASAPLKRIVQWFDEHSEHGMLLCVEFRETPVVYPQGGKAAVAEVVGKALAKGLTYMMIFPFSIDRSSLSQLPSATRDYLESLWRQVGKTYIHILDEACHQVMTLEENKQLNAMELKESLSQILSRFKLYHLTKEATPSSCPGIGYRLFYTETLDGLSAINGDGGEYHGQRWEWISHDNGDYMMAKTPSIEELEAVIVRYFPILEHWREHGVLPQHDNELKAACAKYKNSPTYTFDYGKEITTPPWTTYNLPDSFIDDFIASNAPPAKQERGRK